jgi:DNA recombination protein RmuC
MELRAEKADLTARNRSLLENEQKQQVQIEALHQKAQLEFEKMATDILKDRTRQFTEANKSNLDAILQPLHENIAGFKKMISDTHLQDTKDRTTLETKISELIRQTNQVSEQANNLATALKGQVKKQGNWGEMILESILEQSGLVKDRQYFLQNTIRDLSGKQLRPDVLIKLPGSRTIIVDSKVSLLAYDRYMAAQTKEQQQLALKDHLQSMYQHIDQLHGKNYDQIEEALDFTMLFVPIEPAYLLGIQEDPALWAHAYSKRILLISPTNLIACLKLMDDLWKREMQSQHALEIVKQAERIYEKLVGFSQSMEAVGDQLGKAQSAYQKAMGQMMTGKGNLVDQAVKLKSMGLKSSKTFSRTLMENANAPDALLEEEAQPDIADPDNIPQVQGQE